MGMIFTSNKSVVLLILFSLIFVTVLSVSSTIRYCVSIPLVAHEPNANGDICYVLAGGGALWERLDAASDLVQMGRVPRILLMRDDAQAQYNFRAKASWTRTQWAVDYLKWRGISREKILLLPQAGGVFGTLTEARVVAKTLPKNAKTLVVVSSAPHMRRALLAFRRSLAPDIRVIPYAATSFENSYELYHPIWLEYLKLIVYFVIA
jgi:uncharacterized SAM-binding protein YcdF (DUF218 family)